jgi:hypothetical protein
MPPTDPRRTTQRLPASRIRVETYGERAEEATETFALD